MSAADPPHDAQWIDWVQRIARGDEGGLSALYDASSGLVYSIALRVLNDPADAEEVALDVYTQVWRTARTFDRSRGAVSSWLMMLARSRSIDKMRSRAGRVQREQPSDSAVERMPSTGDSPEESAAITERRQTVREALSTLSQEQREAIELSYYFGYSHSELSDLLGQPVGTIKTRIRLGMMKLRTALGVVGLEEGVGA